MFQEPDRRRIYLLRHAEAAYLKDGGTPVADTRIVGLTADGEDQARRQSEVLPDVDFDRAVCSGLPRTRATAGFILAGRTKPTLEVSSGLEEIHGPDHDYKVTDLQRWIRHVANPWADAAQEDSRFLGGELFSDFARRVLPAFSALIDDRSWRTLLIVAHGGVNRLLLNHMMNLQWQGAVSIEQDACCINIVDVDMDAGRVERYLVRGINITGYNLSKRGMSLTDMERAAQRIAAAAQR